MNILNVNSTLSLRDGGGTAERTFEMSRHLSMVKDVICTSLTLDIGLDNNRIFAQLPASLVALPTLSKRFHLPLGGWKVIRNLVIESDVIHMMNHWSFLNILVYLAARIYRKPYVICPAGSLLVFGRSKILKYFYNLLIGKRIISEASACIAVTKGEFTQFKSYGVLVRNIVVIPNAINFKDFSLPKRCGFLKKFKLNNQPYILFMGRLNSIKGPDILLQAFINIHSKLPKFHLVFVGKDGGMLETLKALSNHHNISNFVHFLGHLEGNDKIAAYHYARLLVIPSRHEAMSIVALEAGACGTPVLLTDKCGFGEIKKIHPCLEVPVSHRGIAKGLIAILTKPNLAKKIGQSFKRLVIKNYTWQFVISKYLDLYQEIISNNSMK